ncbi:MAG TPA: FAD-dependent oxidoreductase [Dehalococcoidia bacterium]|nr:FAD-dependent oxidoreductase [Dehalococcoidia bacterium]
MVTQAPSATAGATPYPHLFSPLRVGPRTFRNRIYSPPHFPGFMGPGFMPGDRLIAYWEAKARGGVAAVATGVTPVHASAGAGVVPFRRPEFQEAYGRAAEAMHRHGALFVVQPWHPGTQGSQLGGRATWSPSAVVTPTDSGVPHVMTKAEIEEIVDCYGYAAEQIAASGADGVEIHGAHGYLITQFTSAYFNQRDDEYGGNEDGRLRFLTEIVDAVKSAAGDRIMVGMRFSADEFVEGGLTVEESQRMLKRVADSGKLDYLNISIGNYASQATIIPPMYIPLGSFVYAAAGVKEAVDIPVFTVGRINDPQQSEQIIAGGYADVVCMNRAIIADPEWANKARTDRADEIRKCIGCNEACWGQTGGYMGLSGGIGCVLNPDIGHEDQMELTPASIAKSVMVVGGGIAGLEAARVAAERGHRVSLYERSELLGGQMVTAAKAPLRIDFAEPIRYYARQMELLDVDLHLGTEVTEDTISAIGPDALVLATGSTPFVPDDIEGIDGTSVTEVRAVLDETAEVGQRVLLLADEHHQEALSAADFLLDRGHDVTFITRKHAAGREVEYVTIEMLMAHVVELGIRFEPLTWVRRFEGTTATLYSLLTEEERTVEADTVVFAFGGKADDALYHRLRETVPEVHLIGDAQAPRRLIYATRDGNRVGRAI